MIEGRVVSFLSEVPVPVLTCKSKQWCGQIGNGALIEQGLSHKRSKRFELETCYKVLGNGGYTLLEDIGGKESDEKLNALLQAIDNAVNPRQGYVSSVQLLNGHENPMGTGEARYRINRSQQERMHHETLGRLTRFLAPLYLEKGLISIIAEWKNTAPARSS